MGRNIIGWILILWIPVILTIIGITLAQAWKDFFIFMGSFIIVVSSVWYGLGFLSKEEENGRV